MPGLVGIITKRAREAAEDELRRMVSCVKHDDSYLTGTWINEGLGLYLGWTAHPHAKPVKSDCKDIVLLFSGEEYAISLSDVRTMDNRAGRPEDRSAIVQSYRSDAGFPVALNGLFHGVLADYRRGEAILFNDRFGMHRLYYHESADGLYFAAEAKAILAVCPETREPAPEGLGEFVAYNCVLENRTIFRGVHVLPAGSVWTIRDGAVVRKRFYFTPAEWENQEPLGAERYYAELRGVLLQNLPRYFSGPDRVGMTVTGGLDTRVILSLCAERPESLQCYTFGGMFRECQDVRIARGVAGALQLPHSVIPLGQKFLSRFAEYAERTVYLNEGGTNLYYAPDLYASEIAREIAPVKVVGTYGSEIMERAVMFKPAVPADGLFPPEFGRYIRAAGETYTAARRGHPVTFAAFRQSPWYHYGVLALEESQLTVRSPFLDNDFVRTVYRAPSSTLLPGDTRLRLIRGGNASLAAIRSDLGLGGRADGLLARLIRSYLEFTFKAEYAYDYGMPQWLARIDGMAMPLHLERLFLGRHKFIHFRVWYRDGLAEFVRQMLLDSRALSRSYLERKGVEAIVYGHIRGNRNYTSEIHKLLTLELLHRRFFDGRLSSDRSCVESFQPAAGQTLCKLAS